MPRQKPGAQALLLRISVQETDPEIWRRMSVSTDSTLHDLHRIIQVVMGWWDYHLYAFEVRGERYEAPDPEAEGKSSTQTTLHQLKLKRGDSLSYVYDFGDDWQLSIVAEEEQFPSEYHRPFVIEGERAGPPEDCGGVGGLEEVLRVLSNPDPKDDAELLDWLGDYDPSVFDTRTMNNFLVLASGWSTV